LVGGLLLGGLVLSAAAVAQDPAEPNVTGPQPATGADSGALAVVLVEDQPLSCWPTRNSPHYRQSLTVDSVVRVGDRRDGFRQVLLPLGPLGFVHKKFASEPDDGKVVSKGKAVSFRRRPQSGEAPVTSLAEGTELWLVGEEGDWWCVRFPARDCWVTESALQIIDEPTASALQAHDEFMAEQRGQVQAYLTIVAEQRAAAELAATQRQQLQALQDRLAVELQRPPTEQALAELASATQELLASMAEEAELRPAGLDLERRITAQQWIVEAVAVRDEQPVPPRDLLPPPPANVPDPLERFQAVGFLRWQRGFVGPGKYVIEKGGQPLYVVSCDSGRYDLSIFVDREVGLIGSRRRPATESLRLLDVERSEGLSGRR